MCRPTTSARVNPALASMCHETDEKDLSTVNENPYEPTVTTAGETSNRLRWVRPIVTLNFILLALPAFLIGFAYAWMHIQMRREAESYGGGPVTYQTEFIGFSGPAWSLLTYFLVPNILMIAYLMFSHSTQK